MNRNQIFGRLKMHLPLICLIFGICMTLLFLLGRITNTSVYLGNWILKICCFIYILDIVLLSAFAIYELYEIVKSKRRTFGFIDIFSFLLLLIALTYGWSRFVSIYGAIHIMSGDWSISKRFIEAIPTLNRFGNSGLIVGILQAVSGWMLILKGRKRK